MPAPYDYLSQLPGNAFETALKGYQENLKAQEADANKKMMESDLAALAGNTSASVQDYNKLMLKYPALQEQLGNSWKMMEGNRRQGLMDYGSKGLFALDNNDTNTAIKLTEDYATALENSGKPDEAAQIRAVSELIKYDPKAARTSFKLSLMAGMGVEKFAELEAKKAEAQAKQTGEVPSSVRETLWWENATPEQRAIFDKLQAQGKPGTTINLPGQKAQSEGQTILAKKAVDSVDTFGQNLTSLQQILDAEKILPKAITGSYGETRTDLARLVNTLGLGFDESVPATQQVQKTVAKIAVDARQQMGSGTSISNEEQKLVTKANSAEPYFTDAEIKQVLAFAKRVAIQTANKSLSYATQYYKNSSDTTVLQLLQDQYSNADPNVVNNLPKFMEFFGSPANAPTPGGTQTPAGAAGGMQPPSEAILFLKANPNLASQFDAKYGQGASKAVLGK